MLNFININTVISHMEVKHVNDMLLPEVIEFYRLLNINVSTYKESKALNREVVEECGAQYSAIHDSISLNEFRYENFTSNKLQMSLTFLHELIHWSGHSLRLNRIRISNGENPNTWHLITNFDVCTEELIAEIGSRILFEQLGFKFNSNIRDIDYYIRHFVSHRGDIEQAYSKANEAVNYLLELVKQAKQRNEAA